MAIPIVMLMIVIFMIKPQSLTFEVEKYLHAQATRFNIHYDANCYLILSKCMDLMDLGRGFSTYDEGVRRIQSKSLLLAFDKDTLIPKEELRHLANLLHAHGREVLFDSHPSLFGHDAFLKEYKWLNMKIGRFFAS
jgi:homoserine O-acetyltransferase